MLRQIYVNNDGVVQLRNGRLEDIFPNGVYQAPDDKFIKGDKLVLKQHPHRCTVIIFSHYEGRDTDNNPMFRSADGGIYHYSKYTKLKGKSVIDDGIEISI